MQGDLTERLLAEIEGRARSEGPEQLGESLRLLGNLPMRRPWPIIEPLTYELRALDSLEPQLLTEILDGLARLRYDDPKLLDVVDTMVERSLEMKHLHEAQACAIMEAFGTLGHQGRSGALIPHLVERIAAAQSLLPHSVVSLVHAFALLRIEPVDPLPVSKISSLLSASGLPLELADVGLLIWSYVELGCAEAAMDLLRNSFTQEMIDAAVTADLHTLTLLLWSLLALRAYETPLLVACMQSIGASAPGIHLPSQLCRLAECMLMMQLEAPQTLGLALPPELCMKAQYAWQQAYTPNVAERPSQQLIEVSAGLDALGLTHRVRFFNTYPMDVYISHEVTDGTTFSILLHPSTHYTSSRSLLGSLQLKSRLLQALGCVVLHIRHDDWNDKRTDDMRRRALQELLQPHMKPLPA